MWECLDYGDIEQSLANKLRDEDVQRIFICIDATNRLKILKLARCINITGSGLEVLIGSTVLQKIDLSLVKRYEEPKITPKPRLDQVTIFVILDSIIDASDNSLRHVQLPEHILRTMSNLLVILFFSQEVKCILRSKRGLLYKVSRWVLGKHES